MCKNQLFLAKHKPNSILTNIIIHQDFYTFLSLCSFTTKSKSLSHQGNEETVSPQEEERVEFLLEDLQEEIEEVVEVFISALLKMKIRSSTTSTKRSLKQKPENQEGLRISTELMDPI